MTISNIDKTRRAQGIRAMYGEYIQETYDKLGKMSDSELKDLIVSRAFERKSMSLYEKVAEAFTLEGEKEVIKYNAALEILKSREKK